ncbi:hypothetical protein XENTR_v10022601 [Xenopus tropicalis]|nr:hypothetical protein XENTR_v10022601 [Xenopus tropicalis]
MKECSAWEFKLQNRLKTLVGHIQPCKKFMKFPSCPLDVTLGSSIEKDQSKEAHIPKKVIAVLHRREMRLSQGVWNEATTNKISAVLLLQGMLSTYSPRLNILYLELPLSRLFKDCCRSARYKKQPQASALLSKCRQLTLSSAPSE